MLNRQPMPSSAPQRPQSGAPSLMPMIVGAWVSQAICIAAELGLADLLAEGAGSSDELAGRTGTRAASLSRLLRLLAACGVVREIA